MSFELANKVSADLIKKGNIIFSPISMSHPISILGNLKGDWETWRKIDFEFIKWCDEVVIVNFSEDAVNNSTGVQGELMMARELGKEISNYYTDLFPYIKNI